MAENKEKKGTKSKIKVIVTFIILYLIDQLVRIIDGKWFLLAFILLVAYIFIGGTVIKLMHKEKTNNLETNNEIISLKN